MSTLPSAQFFCEHCKKETHFFPIRYAVALTGVSRSTVYYWMDRRWVHWLELPSRRRIICKESLSRRARPDVSFLTERIDTENNSSKSVQSRAIR
jgi:predicted DNA-binding transcriptional regulator AlpA